MNLSRAQRLDIAVGKSIEVLDGFSKYLDLLATLSPNDAPTQEMSTLAKATNVAAQKLLEFDPELMVKILPPKLLAMLKSPLNDNSTSFDPLAESLQSFSIEEEADDLVMEQGSLSTTPKEEEHTTSATVIQYISRWIKKYQSTHFITMKQALDSCNNSFLKSYYNTIAFAIERRFAKVFASKEKSKENSLGKIEIISTVMPTEVFQLWLFFQYFSSSSIPFERTWNVKSNFSTWSHSLMLNHLSVPVFQTKNYFKWEYQVHNNITKQKEYFRMYAYKMEMEYEFESQLFTITACIRKEKFFVVNRQWQIRE